MKIDISTLFIALSIASAMSSAFVWMLHFNRRSLSGTLTIATSNTLFFIGFTLIALRTVISPHLSFLVANAFLFLGYSLFLHGLSEFFGRRPNIKFVLAALILYCGQFAYFYYISNLFQVRLFFYLLTHGIIIVFAFIVIFKEYKHSHMRSHFVASLFIGFSALVSVGSGLLVIDINATNGLGDIRSYGAINIAVIAEQFIFILGWTYSFTLMVNERLYNERVQAEAALYMVKSASSAKSEFLANMSHELRTPLNAIMGFADAMRVGLYGAHSHYKYAEYANDIYDSGEHLLDLITEILDLSAIEAGKMMLHKEEFRLNDAIGSCIRLVSKQAEKSNIAIHHSAGPILTVFADKRRIKEVILNLLSNSIKFTPENGTITLSTFSDPQGEIVITISDTGVGMDADGIATALTPFGQMDTPFHRQHEGTGLGLPLSKSLVELHGGSLAIESGLGIGTTITVRLPTIRLPGECAQAGEAPAHLQIVSPVAASE
jgi:signal transduction histidine kinase